MCYTTATRGVQPQPLFGREGLVTRLAPHADSQCILPLHPMRVEGSHHAVGHRPVAVLENRDMDAPPPTVFLSYRRDVSAFIARAIFMDLRQHGYDVFMAVESIDSGQF